MTILLCFYTLQYSHDMPQTTVRLGFHIITDPAMGGGVERWLINTLSSVPHQFNITVISTGFSDRKRLEKESQSLKKYNNIKLNLFENKFRFFRKNRIMSFILDNFFLPFFLFFTAWYYRIYLKGNDSDIVYLTKNQYWRLFKGKVLMGSSHTEFHEQGLINTMKAKLYASGILYRKISAFHIYPGRDRLKLELGKRAMVMELPNGTPEIECAGFLQEQNIKFLFVGRIEKIKGIEVLINGWKMAKVQDRSTLFIIGSGSVHLSEDNENGIKVLGQVSDQELHNFYCNSDIFLYPTLWDSFPYTVIEAMSAGCFIISGSVIRSSFKDAENQQAIKFISSNPNSLAEEIRSAVERISTLRNNREERRKFFIENYSSTRINEKFFSAMNDLSEKTKIGHMENI